MTAIDWVIFVLAWSLVPAALIMKAYFDRRQAKADREFWKRVAQIKAGER